MNIILLAPPAAGKGTQAEILLEKYNLNHISTGNLLRSTSNENSDFGKQLKQKLESGNLVSDDIVLSVLNRYLDKTDNSNLLLDGFPRNVYQAEKLDEILKQKQSQVDYVFLLDVEKSILEKRITGRRLCESCGKVYNVNIDSLKPINDNICDKCGCDLYTRKDDNLDTFQTRYQEYINQTFPLIDYYKTKGKLYEIDSSVSKEETFTKIEMVLGKR